MTDWFAYLSLTFCVVAILFILFKPDYMNFDGTNNNEPTKKN